MTAGHRSIHFAAAPLNAPLSSWWTHVGPLGFYVCALEHLPRMRGSQYGQLGGGSLARGPSELSGVKAQRLERLAGWRRSMAAA